MKLAAGIIFASFSSAFKLTNSPSAYPSRHVGNMPFTRRATCPMVPVRPGQAIPGFEDRNWNLPEIFRRRMNKKIQKFEQNFQKCDTMLVRIENDQVIDICFHYEWEIGNPWSLETTCVSEKYKEIDCYMGTSPFGISQMPKSCEDKEDMPIFLSPSLMETGLGALLYDFDPESFQSESSSQSFGQEWSGNYESLSYDPLSESYGPYESADSTADDLMWYNSLDEVPETPEKYYYIDSNGNLQISDCDPSSPNCNVYNDQASSELRRRKRGLPSNSFSTRRYR